MRKLILFLVALSSYSAAHMNECVVCSAPCPYEFTGSMNNRKSKEEFWRGEEQVCEKHALAELRGAKENVSPRLDEELSVESEHTVQPCEIEQPKSKAMQKLMALKKVTRRISMRR